MKVRVSGMSVNRKKTSLSGRILLSALLITSTVSAAFQVAPVSAAQITARTLTLQAGTTDGGSKPSGVVNHQFNFTVPTTGSIGSIQFLYCTTASNGPCVKPTGLSTTAATLGSETGATGFTINNTTDGAPYITRTAASVTGATALSYRLSTVTNPSATNTSFFVRISTFVATNATGAAVDTGTVTASTANPIILTGTMPESIIFCTGATITTVSGIPDCSTATSGAITFNQLFSPSDTATATSQMAASTNATTGYNITVSGPTMTSGSNTIPAMTTSTAGARGTGQFGLNLRANTTATSTPSVGTDILAISNGTNLRGQPATGYATPDNFKFVSGDTVANSAFNTPGPTNSQIYTASYIVNVSGSQTAGTYTSTLTYICTAAF
jgi:hypothetical protein